MSEQTLGDYVRSIAPDFDPIVYASGSLVSEFDYFLNSILIVPLDLPEIKLPQLPVLKNQDKELGYTEYIDNLIKYMLNNKINNALTLGFTDGLKNNVSSSINSRDKNFNSIILKNNIFKIIRSVIGDSNFLKLIFHNNAILKKNLNFVLFGPIPKRKQIFKKNMRNDYKEGFKCHNLISLNRMLYANKSMAQYNDPIGESYEIFIRQVFMNKNNRWFKNLPKKFPLIFKLFSNIYKNHDSLKYSYSYIFDSVCCDDDGDDKNNNNETQVQTDIIKSQTSKKKIIKFIIIIISKIFPVEVFGDSINFQIIISRISQYINRSKINNFMKISDIIKNIKLNNIQWIRNTNKKTENRNQNKFEFERSKEFFSRFIYFLFNKFINSLICLFFHVSEISQTHNLIYFKHNIWNKLIKNFENRFFNNNLKLVTDSNRCHNKLYNFNHNTHLIGKMKILPKLNNDFRIIVKPNRFNSNSNDIDYNNMVNFEIKPILKILKYQNRIHLQKKIDCQGKAIYNVNDLPSIIHKYKKQLFNEYGISTLPEIFVLKFDAKNCYDSIPVNEILNKIDDLFPNENQMFYTRYINNIDSYKIQGNNNNSFKKKLIMLNKPNIDNFDSNKEEKLNKNDNSVKTSLVYDNAKTVAFNKEKIKKIIEYQLFNSAIYKNNKTYIRKDGLFQGYPLSGALCDILYDSIELKFLKILNESDNEEPIGKNNNCLIRIADDFLILSDNYHSINKLKRLVSRRIDKFNFTVNRLKTINNFSDKSIDKVCAAMSSINFCGYNIDLTDLSIIKSFESFNSYPFKSHINTFNKLCIGCFKIFKLRINSNYLNPNYNDFKHLKKNIINSTISIFKKFIKTFNNLILLDRFNIENFENLLIIPMRKYVNSFYKGNYSLDLITDIFSSIILHSIKEFKKYGKKFQSIIICLEQFI